MLVYIQTLIKRLREYTYWLGKDESYSRDIHPPICDEAARMLEQLLMMYKDVKAENDLAMKELHGHCPVCKHYSEDHNKGKCATCVYDSTGNCRTHIFNNWEFEGPKGK